MRTRRSLGGRLVLILSCLMLVLIGLELTQHFDRLNSRQEVLRTVHRRVATAAAAATAARVDAVFELENGIAAVALDRTLPEEKVREYLQRLAGEERDLASIQVIEPNGFVRFLEPGGPLNSVADEEFFRSLSLKNRRFVSDVFVTHPDEQRYVRIASLHTDLTGDVLGIIALVYHVDPGTDHWLAADMGAGDRTDHVDVLLDNHRQVVSSQGDETLVRFIRDDPALRQAPRDERLTLSGRPGEPPLAGFAAAVAGTPWLLVHVRNDEQAVSDIQNQLAIALPILILTVAAFTVTSIVVVKLGLRPHRRLSIVAERLGGGDLSLRLPRAELEEFELLVNSFNRMAERLETAQRALTDANHDLEHRVADRTRELEEQHDRLLRAERLSTLGLFSSAIAHELRNPLNNIGLSLYWLKAKLEPGADDRTRARLDSMDREIRRSERIIQTLLAFARTGAPEPTDVALAPLVQEVLEVAHPDPRITVHARLEDGLPPLHVDRAQVFQVLDNLVRNACQAMPSGGTLTLTVGREGAWCHLAIADSGPGIPAEMRESIFEPLVTTKSTGTGLGLALCKRIVDAHGGQIWVESAPGHGAAFHLRLPLAGAN